MAQLPQFQDDDMPFQQMQNRWAAILNPIISLPMLNGGLLKNVALKVGANAINHKLSRIQQGFIIVDQDAKASIYRSQPLNASTLTLTSDQIVTISLWVF